MITLADVQAAAKRLDGRVVRTPTVSSAASARARAVAALARALGFGS